MRAFVSLRAQAGVVPPRSAGHWLRGRADATVVAATAATVKRRALQLSPLAGMHSAAHFILYVADQARSRAFYAAVLAVAPRLDVPGMTEFLLPGNAVLGLMPERGIRALLGDALADPATARGVPRAELYLVVSDASAHYRRALAAGAVELSGPMRRDWGHEVSYVADPDGHVVAFARPSDPLDTPVGEASALRDIQSG